MTSTIAAVYSLLDNMTVSYTDMNGASATATCYTLSEMLDSVETAHTPCRLLMLPTSNLTIGPGTMGESVYTIQDLFLLEAAARTEGSKVIMPVLLSYMVAYQDAIMKKWSFQSTWQNEAITPSVTITPGKYTYPASSDSVWYGVMVQITINEVI